MDRDRLGRRRAPGQDRGLRPLHPALPETWMSRAVRLTMAESDWARFEALADALADVHPTTTRARSLGRALADLLDRALPAHGGPTNWMDWERQKTLKLLRQAV